jgi:hypothetical protein
MAAQRMQAKAGEVHLAQLGRGVQRIQADEAAPPEVRPQATAATVRNRSRSPLWRKLLITGRNVTRLVTDCQTSSDDPAGNP